MKDETSQAERKLPAYLGVGKQRQTAEVFHVRLVGTELRREVASALRERVLLFLYHCTEKQMTNVVVTPFAWPAKQCSVFQSVFFQKKNHSNFYRGCGLFWQNVGFGSYDLILSEDDIKISSEFVSANSSMTSQSLLPVSGHERASQFTCSRTNQSNSGWVCFCRWHHNQLWFCLRRKGKYISGYFSANKIRTSFLSMTTRVHHSLYLQ